MVRKIPYGENLELCKVPLLSWTWVRKIPCGENLELCKVPSVELGMGQKDPVW